MTAQSVAKVAELLDIRGGKPMVSSLTIAEIFERRHDNVLAAIRKELSSEISALELKEADYIDKNGERRPMFWLNEEQSLFVMPFVGGRKSREGQRRLVRAYLYYRDAFANPPRRELLTDKRRAGRAMTDILKEVREEAGKDTQAHHYMVEHKLCNWALTGRFEPADESALSNEDTELLRRIRTHNTSLIDAGIPYAERKPRLAAFATRHRTKLLR